MKLYMVICGEGKTWGQELDAWVLQEEGAGDLGSWVLGEEGLRVGIPKSERRGIEALDP